MSKIRANQITNENVNGAPEFPHGLTTVGVQTVSLGNTSITGDLTVNGDANVGGVVTYEDVTSVDSVGIVTARSGLKIGPTAGVGATIFADGSINASGIITSTNVSVAGSVTAATFHGSGANMTNASTGVLERVSGQCDGSTRSCNFGTFTFPNVTAEQRISTTTYTKVNSSEITYKPPAGCIGVMYEHHYLSSWIGGSHAIQHHRLYISGSGDGISGETEVTYGRYNKAAQYHGGLIMVRFYFRIRNDGGSFTTTRGSLPTWNNNHTIYIKSRHYNGSTDVARFHQTNYWDGEGTTFHQPSITITAYGSPT